MRQFVVSFFLTLLGVTGALAQFNGFAGHTGAGTYAGAVKGGVYSYAAGVISSGGGGGATGFTASGPSSGIIGVASTNFTVTATGGTFTGSQTITIADGSSGGTLTPSVGSPGTSTVTVTPTNGATSFTFTYTPIVVATLTLTFTNGQSWTNPSPLNYASAASSTQSAALLARMDGSENQVAVDQLISGLVTDGTYSIFDGLYVFATNSTTNANLNWAQNAFNLTAVAACCTFATNQGYTGNGTSQYFTTGFNPNTAGGHWTLNSATIGHCTVTSSGASEVWVPEGSSDGTNLSFTQPMTTGGTTYNIRLNTSNAAIGFSNTNSQGSFIAARTSSTNLDWTKNGAAASTGSQTSTALTNAALFVLAFNNNGTAADFDGWQTAYIFYGGALSSAQATSVYNRLHTYLQAVGETTAC